MSLVMHRKSDKIAVLFKDGESEFTLYFSPLTMAEKGQFVSMAQAQGSDPMEMLQFAKTILGATLKDVKGIVLPDGSNYVLDFNGGRVSDACLDDLMNLDMVNKVVTVATKFISGVPQGGEIKDPQGNILEGVTVKKSL